MSVPILPPEESHRAGISLVAALEARAAECRSPFHSSGGVSNCISKREAAEAYEEALELVRVASRGYGGDR